MVSIVKKKKRERLENGDLVLSCSEGSVPVSDF